MTRTSRLAVLTTLTALLAACPEQHAAPPNFLGPSGSMKQGIVGGSADTNTAHTAVAYIEMTAGACTGTLVTGQWVVTAAHCTWNGSPTEPPDTANNNVGNYTVCFTTPGATTPSRCVAVSAVYRHNSWNTDSNARRYIYDDVALLKLAENVQTKWSITPIPILPSSLLSNLYAGKTVEYSGYGITKYPGVTCTPEYGNCGGGTKMHVSAALDKVCDSPGGCYLSNGGTASQYTLCGTQNPGGTCSGDSGGPAFLVVGGTEYVVGATSYGDQNCQYFGCSTNLARFESFLAPYLGKQLANGASCTQAMDCKSSFCVAGKCCNQPCTAGCYTCSTGTCTALVNTACNDNNPCTINDLCNGGSCSGSIKDCGTTSGGGCTVGGTCNLSTGICDGAGPRPNGTACEDGNPCTQGDTCQSGACTAGAASNSCPAPDSCHDGSACNVSTGKCDPFPQKPNGTSCDDANPCTGGDSCLAGTCLPSTRVSCPAPDACHEAGTCSASTGKCPSTYPAKPNGTSCNDGNACTTNDACAAGVCKGAASSSACPADQCHAAGTCSAATGLCSGSNKADGTSCNDADSQTENDTCTAGICKGRPIGLDPCYGAPAATDCDDKNACTRDDFCLANVCTGTNPKPCTTPPDDCHEKSGTCDWQNGNCVYKAIKNGLACDDGDDTTTDDHCETGRCIGTPVTPGECDGQPDGTACADGSCKDGACTNVPPPPATGSCGCGSAGGAAGAPSALLMGLVAAGMIGRRRRS